MRSPSNTSLLCGVWVCESGNGEQPNAKAVKLSNFIKQGLFNYLINFMMIFFPHMRQGSNTSKETFYTPTQLSLYLVRP